MITAYFLVAAFATGWFFGADQMIRDKEKFTFWERVATVALCLAWPFCLVLLVIGRGQSK